MSPPPNTEETLPETVHFDKNGDTRLLVTSSSGLHVFIVSSKTMTLVCDAWRSMLSRDGGFKEAQPGADDMKEVSFPEDDAVALSIMLNIAHLNFRSVPATVSLNCLWNLAVLTDKYGATKLVQPWIKGWIKGVKDSVTLRNCREWIWIAWEFGEEKIFETVAGLLTKEALYYNGIFKASRYGTPILDPEDEDCLLPPGIIESITTVRNKTIDQMIQVCLTNMVGYNTGDTEHIPPCTQYEDIERCNAIVYGSLHLALMDIGIVGLRERADTVPWGVTTLGSKLLSIEILTLPATSSRPTITHEECNIQGQFRQAIWYILNRMPPVVTEQHYEHLRRQREILS